MKDIGLMRCVKVLNQTTTKQRLMTAKDQKSLFKFTNELIHRQRDVSLPTHDNPLSLANNVAQIFVEKIEMISQTFMDSTRSERINSDMSVLEIIEFQIV